MVSKQLTTYLKVKYRPIIKQRDGDNCFYCNKPFPSKFQKMITVTISKDKRMDEVYDHLNNNEEDNRIENLVFAHRLCNEQKKYNNNWIVKAKQKLRDNELSAQIPEAHANTDKETATETDTNAIFAEITLKALAHYLQPRIDGIKPRKTELEFKEFLDLLAGRAYKLTGHASQNTMRRIVDMFCTTEYPYIKEKNEDKKWIIRLRTEEEFESDDEF